MSKINVKIEEGCGCGPAPSNKMPNAHNGEEARMHRTTLAHLIADVKVLLDLVQDGDDLPEWLETKITKAGDYMSSAARYIAGSVARDHGQLEEEVTDQEEKELKQIKIQLKKASHMHKKQSDRIDDIIDEESHLCEIDMYHGLYESLYDAVTEENEAACQQCLYEVMSDAACDCSDLISEAKYRGRKVKLNKPMRGDVKKFKVYVRDPKTGNVKKVNFGDKKMRIKKSNPKRRKSFRARHNCKNPGPKTKARYWSCRKW